VVALEVHVVDAHGGVAAAPSDRVADPVADRLLQVGPEGMLPAGLEGVDPHEGANERVLDEIRGVGAPSRPARQAPSRPALERRNEAREEDVESLAIALANPNEQITGG